VLVVEDNLVNQRVAGKILERFGCTVTIANDGLEAVEHFSRNTFDLILMDCQMPNLDGFGATRMIRAEEERRGTARTPILAMTANVLESDRESCLNAGMDDFLPKPVVKDKLRATLEHWLLAPTDSDASVA
ncbi:MAG: response regulator, partial [Pseudomonadota bacterium]